MLDTAAPAVDAAPFSGWDTQPDVVLTLPMPPSANRMWRHVGSKVYRSAEYMKWLTNVEWLGVVQRAADHIPGAYVMRLTVPRNRRDLDNNIKPVNDGLQRMRVVAEDKHADAILLQRLASRKDDLLVELWALP